MFVSAAVSEIHELNQNKKKKEPWFGQHYSVLKEIVMITFSLWCTGLLTNSMRRYAQKLPLFKKMGKLDAQERC